MLHSLLEVTTEEEKLEGNLIEIECFNCHKKGHKKAECWAKGGRKEGQGPRMKLKKDKEELKKETASAVVEEGVWMAITNDSEDEHMANSEFDNFTISEEDLLFSDEGNEEKEVQKFTKCLKRELKIADLLKYIHPYDDPDFMLNI